MYLRLNSPLANYNIQLKETITVVSGDSSTGKSKILSLLRQGQRYTTDATKVYLNCDTNTISYAIEGSLLIVDTDELLSPDVLNSISHAKRDDVKVLLLGRRYLNHVPLPTNAIYKFITVKGITNNVPYTNSHLCNVNKFKHIVTEDSESGFYFMKSCFPETTSCAGNSNVIKSLNEDTVVIFDTLGFGAYLTEFLDKIKRNPRLSYIGWLSMEGFLLTQYLSKNIDDTCFNPEHKAFTQLCELLPGYSKKCKELSSLTYTSNKLILSKSEYNILLKNYDNTKEENNLLFSAINSMNGD